MDNVLSTSSAVAGLLSVTIQITQATHRHISASKSVPQALSYYLEELVCLKRLLADVQDAFLFQSPSDLGSHVPLFALDLTDLEAELGRLCEKLQDAQRRSVPNLLRAVAWPFGDDEVALWTQSLSRYRHRIQSAVAISNLRLQVTALEEIRTMRYRAEVEDKEAMRLRVIDWVFGGTVRTKQRELTANHHTGTGEWIFDTPELKKWIAGGTNLWCYGGPGVGKTQLVSLLVNKLSSSRLTAYFYCNHQASLVQAAPMVASSLLRQLLEACPSLPPSVTELYERLGHSQEMPRLDDITTCLSEICAKDAPVYVLVDALDEVGSSRRRKGILSMLNKLSRAGARVLVTSRTPDSGTKQSLDSSLHLEIRSDVSDMKAYVEHVIDESSELSLLVGDAAKGELVQCVVERADRMFLLAVLHCNHLCHLTRRSEVQRALKSLPRGIETAYEESMRRIEGDSPERKALALATLSWIFHARRALTVDELLQALALDPSTGQLGHEDIPNKDMLVDTCAGLVILDPESRTARFTHYSVREYFQRGSNYDRWLPHSKQDITRACLAFLGLECFDCGENPSGRAIAALQTAYPLLTYAACFWADHAREGYQGTMDSLALRFLGSKGNVKAAAVILDDQRRARKYWGTSASIATSPNLAVQLAARFGALDVLWLLLERTAADPRAADDAGRTALHWAARGGSRDTVLALAAAQPGVVVDVDPRCVGGRTPLQWAAKYGHGAVVRALMDRGADPAAASADGRTALHWAASRGHWEVVELLLRDEAVDAAAWSRRGWTALHWAACGGKRTIVVRGVEGNEGNEGNREEEEEEGCEVGEPFVVSTSGRGTRDYEETVALLLRAGVSPRTQTIDGRLAMDWAAAAGNANLLRMIMESGGGIESSEATGVIPSHHPLESKAELAAPVAV